MQWNIVHLLIKWIWSMDIAWDDVCDVFTKKKFAEYVVWYDPLIFKGANPTSVNIYLCEPSEGMEGYIPDFKSGFLLWWWWKQSWKELYFSTNHFCVDLFQWACYSKK